MEMPSMFSLIHSHLKIIGADGLCGDGCGCDINDLCCCASDKILNCVPAKKVTCFEACEIPCESGHKTGQTCYQPMQLKEAPDARDNS